MQLLHWARSNYLLSYPIIIIALLVFREIVLHQLKNHIRIYQIILFPGVVIHELSHFVFCLLSGARVHNVEFFSPSGGSVTHSKPKLPVIGMFLISLAPFLVGITLVYFLYPQLIVFDSSQSTLWLIISKVIISYLLVAIIISMFPSGRDFKNAWPGYITIALTSILAGKYLALSPTNISQALITLLLATLAILISTSIVFYFLNLTIWKKWSKSL